MLPPELYRFTHLRFIQAHSGEYSSECPVCRDYGHVGNDKPDRFRMWSGQHARGWCRRCRHFEWADGGELTPERMYQARLEKERLDKAETLRMQRKIATLQSNAYWQGWHDSMGKAERKLWEQEGIPAGVQDWFTLGFTPQRPYNHEGKVYSGAALTIPFKRGNTLTNVQFKLLGVPEEVGKYRFTSGLPASLFLTEPGRELKGCAIVVEGAKKAIITWMNLGERVEHVIGLPSKYPSKAMVELLRGFEQVFLVLDPDAGRDNKDANSPTSNEKITQAIGPQARYARLPMKVDDLLRKRLVTPDALWSIIQQGRRV